MSNSFRDASRQAWTPATGYDITDNQIQIGCLQRIADATELMAKRHQELISEKERAESSAKYWREASDRRDRQLIAARGQITKLKNRLAAKVAA
jgi:hypothetical protein